MRQTSLILIIPLFLFSFSTPTDNPKKQRIDQITADLVNEVIKDNIGALTVTVLDHDSIIYFKSHGPINKFNKFLPDTSTIFRIASISKSFAAVLMLKLIEEGRFKLDDPIENYLPEVKRLKGYSDTTKITFRQLASHTAGLQRNSSPNDGKYGVTIDWEKKTLSSISHTKFVCRPNSQMIYSNIGYAILGLAMSRAANTPYIKLITDKIFVPLKMNNTYFDVPDNKLKNLAAGTCDCGMLKHKNTKVPKKEQKGIGYGVPSGGIYSTASDFTKFLALLMGTSKQKIISDTSLRLMQKGVMKYPDAIRRTFKNVEYGLGTVIYHLDNDVTIFAHSGSLPGYWTTYAFDNKKKIAVLIMLNYDKHLDNEGTVVKILNQL
jgi:CubicO group peptidase (beta-lactamase class C family)